MRNCWLFRGVVGVLAGIAIVLLVAFPSWAAGLTTLQFDSKQSQLEFQTDRPVQPLAQLLANPTRLVIDLPGILLDEPTITQPIGGMFRHVRAVQLNDTTTRLILELAPNYSLDPKQIRFQGQSSTHWVVQVPVPQSLASSVPVPQTSPPPPAPSPLAALSPSQGSQITTLPPRPPSPITTLPTPTVPTALSAPVVKPAILQAIEFNLTNGQLLIQTDRAVTHQGQWQGNEYRLRLTPATLAPNIREPQLPPGSPLRRVRFQQDDPQTVSLVLLPAAGVQIDQVNILSAQLLAVQLRQPAPPVPAPVTTVPPLVWSTPPASPPVSPRSVPVPNAPLPVTQPPRVQPSPLPTPGLPPGTGEVPSLPAIVVIDPGHGGPDPGAIGIGGLREKDVVLPISLQVGAVLQQQGITVAMTRVDDRDLDLETRVQFAEQLQARLFVSIHANSIGAGRPDINGLETYYYASGDQLAQVIHRHILQFTNVKDRGVKQARFYVLRKTSMPAVLIETGFVSGYEDAARLQDPTSQRQLAGAIATGILQYLFYTR
jgi:N-acetylmuramoyl-L-alanine amidase